MKINKLVESKKLVEEEEKDLTLSEINPQEASVSEIADAVQNSVEDSNNGEVTVSDADAKAVAKEIKDTAEEVDAGFTELMPSKEDYNSVFAENRLTKIFDDALATAKRAMRRGRKANANVLIEGLPGSGKTAIVEAWCNHNGLVLCPINVTDPKLETAINGMPLRDLTAEERNKITQVRSDLFDNTLLNPENKGKCILFVDELNRQQDDQIRRPLMSLFNEKRNADKSLDFSETLLFTIVCINPSGLKYKDKGVVDLNDAEIGRFGANTYMGDQGYDSNVEDALKYCDAYFEHNMLELGINVNPNSAYGKRTGIVGPWKKKFSEEDLEDIDSELKIHDLWSYILSHVDFEFDSRADLDDLHNYKKTLLSARTLYDLIFDSDGDVQRFLRKIGEVAYKDGKEVVSGGGANLLVKDVKMLQKILASYIQDIKELRASVNLFVDADGNVISKEAAKGTASGGVSPDTAADASDEDEEAEDDEDLFGTSSATGRTQSTVGATEADTEDIIGSW